jgi:translation initiation factor 2 alpha subunit (eIF-2alpha)
MASSARVQRHRQKIGTSVRRVEVLASMEDAARIRKIARLLRENDNKSAVLRQMLDQETKPFKSAYEAFEDIRALWPEGEKLNLSRDDLLPDRDFSFD